MYRAEEILKTKQVLVSDGATGTRLQAAGLGPGDCPEEWNLSHPEEVQRVPAEYLAAGSDMVLTNTFGVHPVRLRRHGLEEKAAEFTGAAVRLALEAKARAGRPDSLVALSLGPTGEFLKPLGTLEWKEVKDGYVLAAEAALNAGVEACVVETFTSNDEAAAAVEAAVEVGLFVMATMSFDPAADGYRTMMGHTPEEAAIVLRDAGAGIVGANCGSVEMKDMVRIAGRMAEACGLPVLIHANAGRPVLKEGRTVFPQSPEEMAGPVPQVIKAGAVIVGGCCGTGPEHIAAIRRAVDAVLHHGE